MRLLKVNRHKLPHLTGCFKDVGELQGKSDKADNGLGSLSSLLYLRQRCNKLRGASGVLSSETALYERTITWRFYGERGHTRGSLIAFCRPYIYSIDTEINK